MSFQVHISKECLSNMPVVGTRIVCAMTQGHANHTALVSRSVQCTCSVRAVVFLFLSENKHKIVAVELHVHLWKPKTIQGRA
jgi:hypothetical protein